MPIACAASGDFYRRNGHSRNGNRPRFACSALHEDGVTTPKLVSDRRPFALVRAHDTARVCQKLSRSALLDHKNAAVGERLPCSLYATSVRFRACSFFMMLRTCTLTVLSLRFSS